MQEADREVNELGDIKAIVKEFMDRAAMIDNEMETLKEDRKALVEEFSDRLDMKTLNAALKVLKIEAAVQHKDTYDNFVEALKDPTV